MLKTEKGCKMKLKQLTLNFVLAQEGQDTTHLKQAEKTVATSYEKAKLWMALVAEQVFQLYSNVVVEKTQQPW